MTYILSKYMLVHARGRERLSKNLGYSAYVNREFNLQIISTLQLFVNTRKRTYLMKQGFKKFKWRPQKTEKICHAKNLCQK